MKKPEKKKVDMNRKANERRYPIGYNQACDDWEKFLPNKQEIENIIDKWINNNNLGNYDKMPKLKEYNELAQAIYKRSKGE